MKRLTRFIKIFFKLIFGFLIFLIIAAFFLVRFTNLTISDKGKAILGYNEKNNNWVFNDWELKHLNGWDGPYLFRNENQMEVINVVKNKKEFILKKSVEQLDMTTQFLCQIDADLAFEFPIRNEYLPDTSYYSMPNKLIAISDIEGNFNAFYSFLLANSVMDEAMNWRFEDGHLVLIGDFMDRGEAVTQVLWLIYKLEAEAKKAGGKVHFILGNHEIMNFNAQVRYVKDKYIAIAQQITNKKHHQEAYKAFLSTDNELIKWLKSKNVITQIGSNLFVHAGISPELSNAGMSLEAINQFVTTNLNHSDKSNHPAYDLIFGNKGPLWYRGLIRDNGELSEKIEELALNQILERFGVDKIIIGHSVVKDISSDFDGKVIRIDVKHGKEKHSGLTKGILIKDNQLFKIDDLGQQIRL
jgi:hypothetical protein